MTEYPAGQGVKVRIVLHEPDSVPLVDLVHQLAAIRQIYYLAAAIGSKADDSIKQWPSGFPPPTRFATSEYWPEPQVLQISSGSPLAVVLGSLAGFAARPFVQILEVLRDWGPHRERMRIMNEREQIKNERMQMVNDVFRKHLEESGLIGLPQEAIDELLNEADLLSVAEIESAQAGA